MTPIVSRPNRRPLAIAVAALAALVLLGAGCGETVGYTEATGDKTNGKELFTAKCGSRTPSRMRGDRHDRPEPR